LGQDVGNVTAKAELGMVVLDLLERAISPGQHLHRAAGQPHLLARGRARKYGVGPTMAG
jgi:hypothetical protein